ncbi:DciA family protein [Corynebacterium sp.]|uniref:DciA family protein n=1 Tax=Corynebacterium sp. TaxID=1720 RepID=UPI0026DC1C5E|nr:DciA family protein [Corynebacterium sp.]MDO5077637.1 DciA family protein [Corynebacterium sp.]
MEQQPRDSISSAFEAIRNEAQRRTGKAPDLSKQGQVRRTTTPKRQPPRGRATGPDGRGLWQQPQAAPLGSIMYSELQRRGWRKELAGGWVHGHWHVVVGEKIAEHTKVEMLKDQILHISCDSTAWATNLRMMQRQILHTISERVGPDVVTQLKIYGPKVPSWRKGPLHIPGRGPRDTYG